MDCLCIGRITFKVLKSSVCNFKECSDGRSLMIWPLILKDLIVKFCIIIRSGADINNEIVIFMVLFKIVGNICYWISVCFLQKVGSWICHCDDSVCYVGEIQLLSIVRSLFLWACHDVSYQWFHKLIINFDSTSRTK